MATLFCNPQPEMPCLSYFKFAFVLLSLKIETQNAELELILDSLLVFELKLFKTWFGCGGTCLLPGSSYVRTKFVRDSDEKLPYDGPPPSPG